MVAFFIKFFGKNYFLNKFLRFFCFNTYQRKGIHLSLYHKNLILRLYLIKGLLSFDIEQ